jgi:DNA-binding SARP family transcriptional activator
VAASSTEAIVAIPGPWKAAARQRVALDPNLDADFAEWNAADVDRPRIAILGPVHLEAVGQLPEERVPFYTELAVFLSQRGARGATTDEVIANLWADRGLGANVVRVYIAKLRKWLGEDGNGEPWLPPNPAGGAYLIRTGYLCDWDLFRRRRARGESRGPAGTADLRAALELVRGVPLDGADRNFGRPRNPYAWLPDSSISPYHLTAAIVDTAHALVELYLAAGDTEGARWAVNRAWTADPDRIDDHPWRDLMRIAHAEGHDSEVRAIYEDLITARKVEVPEDLATPTCNLVYELLGPRLTNA